MAFDITSTLEVVRSHVATTGGLASVEIEEPKQPYGDNRFHASVFMRSAEVVITTLDSTVEVHSVIVRLYRDALAEPKNQIETGMAFLVSTIGDNILGDFSLGGNIRNVDIGGDFGQPFRADWGRVEIGQTTYRVADLLLGCVVNGGTTMAP